MEFNIYSSNKQQVASETIYPNRHLVTDEQTAVAAFTYDHVCGEFVNNHRANKDFIGSDVICMDCDNEFSDNPEDWIDEDYYLEEFKDYNFVLVPSRNNMKAKGGKSARPRHHIYFPITKQTDAVKYKAIKTDVANCYSFFDKNTLDAAHFMFGHGLTGVVWHEGGLNIDFYFDGDSKKEIIPEGSRNNTMLSFGNAMLKRYGDTDKAYQEFIERAKDCDPPLDDEELEAIWQSAKRFFHNTVEKNPNYIPADKYNPNGLIPEDYSDIGQAKVIATECDDKLRFTPGTEYLSYDGKVWVENKQKAMGVVEEFLDLQLADANIKLKEATENLKNTGIDGAVIKRGGRALEKLITNQEKEYRAYMSALEYHKFVMKRRHVTYMKSAMTALEPMVLISEKDLDKNEFLINCPDGTYDLRKGMEGFKEHDYKDYLTKITDYAPGDEGEDLWLETLNIIFQNDAELIEYVQMLVGFAAIGVVNMEAMIISYGIGSNGKSTFWNSIARVLGTYSGTISADTLTMGCKGNKKPEIAEAKGKRLIIAAELRENSQLDTSMVKQFCSTDKVEAEKKYKDPFDFLPSHTLVLYTNHLPAVSATDEGTWRRLNVIPFEAKIPTKNKNFTEVLLRKAGAAIMKWIIEGAKKVIEVEYSPVLPKCVVDAIDEYRQENDWMGNFIREYYEDDASAYVSSKAMFEKYRSHSIAVGDTPYRSNEFYKELSNRGYVKVKKGNVRCIKGLKLKPEIDEENLADFLN